VGVWSSKVGGLGWKVWGFEFRKSNISVPFRPTSPFPRLLHVPFLPKIILSLNKQTDKAEFWCHPSPAISVR